LVIGAVEEGIRHRLPHTHTGNPAHGVVERFEMLDVDGGHDVDPGIEQIEHVLIPFLVPAAWGIRMRQLVDDAESRLALHDRVDVQLLEHDAAVLDRAARHDLEIGDPRLGVGAAVRFDEPDDDVNALTAKRRARRRCRCAGARARRSGLSPAGALPWDGPARSSIPMLARAFPRVSALYELFMPFCGQL
jgi:hypothetical protein